MSVRNVDFVTGHKLEYNDVLSLTGMTCADPADVQKLESTIPAATTSTLGDRTGMRSPALRPLPTPRGYNIFRGTTAAWATHRASQRAGGSLPCLPHACCGASDRVGERRSLKTFGNHGGALQARRALPTQHLASQGSRTNPRASSRKAHPCSPVYNSCLGNR